MSILRSTLNRPTLFTPQVNVTGQFHNLTSSGTFPLPGTDTRSSGPSGAVQLSNGSGGFSNNGQLYVQNIGTHSQWANGIRSKPVSG